jgi:hypothetical protein
MGRSLITAMVLGFLATALAGCGFNRHQINQADLPKRVAGVVPGQTTLAELEAMAAPPRRSHRSVTSVSTLTHSATQRRRVCI